jgi:hypothetical protein
LKSITEEVCVDVSSHRATLLSKRL